MVGSDRGQLILVGAIAIALILLGLVLIVNTALFTQVVGSEGTVETTKEGSLSSEEAGQGIATVLQQRNTRYDNINSIDNLVSVDTSAHLNPALRNRTLQSSGSYLWVRYDRHEETGSVVTQRDSNEFTNASGLANWYPIQPSNPGDVGGFQMTIDYSNSNVGETFSVYAHGSGGSGTNRSLSITPQSGGEVDLAVSGGTTCTGIEETGGTVRIDISAGRVYEDGSCQFDLFQGTEPGYVVRFSNGDAVSGTYEFATDANLGTNTHLDQTDASDQPWESVAVWSFEFAYIFDSPGVNIEAESRVIDVYD